MGSSKAPKPADPIQTAAAQTSQNIGTAIANANLNNVNQVGPYGKLSYDVIGTTQYRDPLNGKIHDIPKWEQRTQLNAHGQHLQDLNNQTEVNLANLGREQSSKLQSLLGKPLVMNNEAAESRLWELGRKRLDPMFSNQRSDMQAELANQGIKIGSVAYDRAMKGLGEQENDARNQLLLTGRGQAMQELLQERNQPLNEVASLMSGSQVDLPQFGATNNYGIANTDYAGLQSNYDQQMANRAALKQSRNPFNSLFGLGAAAAGSPGVWSLFGKRGR